MTKTVAESAIECAKALKTLEEQREMFLWKYRDVDRAECIDLLKDFKKMDHGSKGYLDYHEAMLLLEQRGTVKTAKELMDMCIDMDKEKNHHITFIEFCCAMFQKSYDDLFTFVDEEAKDRAMEDVKILGEEAKRVEEDIQRALRAKEMQAELRAAALERESKLTGVAGMRAFFHRQVEGAQDVSKTNEQQIKEEAARRKSLREAKAKMNEAILNAGKVRSAAAEDTAKAQHKTVAESAIECAKSLKTLEEQREMFLWKYRDVTRAECNDLLKDFKKMDHGSKGYLDYLEAMMVLERRGTVKTAKELMDMCSDMDKQKNRHITFIEFCCAMFQKSYDDLFTFVDEEARDRAMEDVKIFAEEAKRVEEDIQRALRAKELQAELRAAALERESKLTGVAGMRAFFHRQVEGAQDVTKTNEQQIKEEAARRKALREAKAKMNEAILNASKVRSAAEVAAEVSAKAHHIKAEEEAEARRKEEEEKAARLARKAALNAKWTGGSQKLT